MSHDITIGSSTQAAADIQAALIRGDVQTGAAEPPGPHVVYEDDASKDTWKNPAQVNAAGKASCNSLSRAAAPFVNASHVGVVSVPQKDGSTVNHCFLVTEGAHGAPPIIAAGDGTPLAPIPSDRIHDESTARGMNNGAALPLELYQGAKLAPIWPPHVDDLSHLHDSPAARAAEGRSYQGAERLHVPTTEAGRLVAETAHLAARAVTPPPEHEPRPIDELYSRHPILGSVAMVEDRLRSAAPWSTSERMAKGFVDGLVEIQRGQIPGGALPSDPKITDAHAKVAGRLHELIHAIGRHIDGHEPATKVIEEVTEHIKGADASTAKGDAAKTAVSEVDAILPGVVPHELRRHLPPAPSEREESSDGLIILPTGFDPYGEDRCEGGDLATTLATSFALIGVGCPGDGRRLPRPVTSRDPRMGMATGASAPPAAPPVSPPSSGSGGHVYPTTGGRREGYGGGRRGLVVGGEDVDVECCGDDCGAEECVRVVTECVYDQPPPRTIVRQGPTVIREPGPTIVRRGPTVVCDDGDDGDDGPVRHWWHRRGQEQGPRWGVSYGGSSGQRWGFGQGNGRGGGYRGGGYSGGAAPAAPTEQVVSGDHGTYDTSWRAAGTIRNGTKITVDSRNVNHNGQSYVRFRARRGDPERYVSSTALTAVNDTGRTSSGNQTFHAAGIFDGNWNQSSVNGGTIPAGTPVYPLSPRQTSMGRGRASKGESFIKADVGRQPNTQRGMWVPISALPTNMAGIGDWFRSSWRRGDSFDRYHTDRALRLAVWAYQSDPYYRQVVDAGGSLYGVPSSRILSLVGGGDDVRLKGSGDAEIVATAVAATQPDDPDDRGIGRSAAPARGFGIGRGGERVERFGERFGGERFGRERRWGLSGVVDDGDGDGDSDADPYANAVPPCLAGCASG